ncbi:MAG: GNAT family N-acetyltransferase [Thermoflexales bacterium]|nr:GNAT family N-acetyltransferase [Thermoflexales bacterium]
MIHGERVRLRAIERSDIPTFVRWFNNPEVRRYLVAYAPMSTAQEEQWFEDMLQRQQRRELFLFAIEARVGDEWVTIGNVDLHRVNWKDRWAILGIVLGEKAYWDQGYGTDAVRTMLRFAFEELNLHRVELEVIDENARARRCYEKAGFRYEGTRRQVAFFEGRYHDSHMMSVLREEFQEWG